MTDFNPVYPGTMVVIRLTGTGYAFQPFDNMVLAHVLKSSKTGRIQEVAAYKSGERYTRKGWTEIFTLPAELDRDAVYCSWPDKGFLPWADGVAHLRKLSQACGKREIAA